MGLQVYYFSTLIYFHTISRRAAKALVRLGGCTVSPEPSLKTCAIGTRISSAGTNTVYVLRFLLLGRCLTHIRLASFLWDIGKQCRPRSDATECGVRSGSPLFSYSVYS